MSYESTVSLCQATSIATTLWSLLDALSSTPAMFAGSELSPTIGEVVPVTCHAAVQGCGRLTASTGATGDVPLSKGTLILQSWQQWSPSSAGIGRGEGKYTQSENHPPAKSQVLELHLNTSAQEYISSANSVSLQTANTGLTLSLLTAQPQFIYISLWRCHEPGSLWVADDSLYRTDNVIKPREINKR